MKKNTLLNIAVSCLASVAYAQEAPAPSLEQSPEAVAEPVAEPVAEAVPAPEPAPEPEPVAEPAPAPVGESLIEPEPAIDVESEADAAEAQATDDLDEESDDDDSLSLEEASAIYQAAPQSVRNFCVYYMASFYGCMGQTVKEYGEDSINHPLFDIFVDQIIYDETPEEIITAMPEEYQSYFAALKTLWSNAAQQALALGTDAEDAAYSIILDQAYEDEMKLVNEYEEAAGFMEAILPHLAQILAAEADLDAKIEAADLGDENVSEQEQYANMLDLMSDTISKLIK